MSQHFIGLDLGTDSVKAVVIKQGLKGGEIVSSSFEPVIHDSNGDNTNFDVVAAAERLLGNLDSSLDVKNTPVYCSLPGDMVSIYKISLPASASRRAKEVLLFELDELLPYSSDDAVFDFMEIKRTASDVLYSIAVVHRDRFKVWIETLQKAGIDPAEVNCAPLVYSSYFNEAGRFNKVSVIVDIGYSRTNISIAGDPVSTSRTVLRGGRLMTSTLREAASADFETAEHHKISEGLNGQVGKILEGSLEMLVLEIRQTFNAHLAEGGAPVEEIYICGGSSKLLGLKDYLAAKLQLPVIELRNNHGSENQFVEHDERN
ncbi:MAG: pilus assembly protein PilM, partial [Deltaproteobacteria bacterium]|nr:pilus assembly protein PilM [Deltaproteobacteria bacterium]